MSHLDELLASHAARHRVVGASLAVLRRGEPSLAVTGTADLERPVTEETPFQIASITKPMVAVVIAMLAERGRLSFEDPVARHVPELRDTSWAERVTLRELMAGTAGIPLTEHREFSFEADGEDALALYAGDVASDPRAAGGPWSYSNAAWCLLGRVVETATGLEWERAIRAELLEPMRMERTTFRTFDERTNAHHYLIADGRPVAAGSWHARALAPAGGSIWSTAGDVLRFASLLLDERFAVLREPHAEVWVPHFVDRWCLGMAVFEWEGGRVWGWDGVATGHRAIMRVIPSQETAIVLLTNCTTGRLMYRSLFTELLADWGIRVPEIPLEPTRLEDLSGYEGTYAWPDRSFRVSRGPNGLMLEEHEEARALTPVDERTFVVEGAPAEAPTLTFGLDAEGRAHAVYRLVWAYPRATIE